MPKLADVLTTLTKIAQTVFFFTAILIGVIWMVAPIRIFLQRQLQWLDDPALTGVLIAGLGMLLAILTKLSTRLDAQEIAVTTLIDLSKPKSLQLIHDDQSGATARCNHILEQKPRRARLIEMSANTVDAELRTLLDIECHTDLLLMHPVVIKSFPRGARVSDENWKASLEWHLNRLKATRGDRKLYKNHKLLRTLYYSQLPGFRGRHFDNRIEISWYCLRDDQPHGTVFGHCNPTLIEDTNTEDGRVLLRTFETAFRAMVDSSVELDDKAWLEAIRDVTSWLATLE